MTNPHAALVMELGGDQKVAAAVGLNSEAVRKWRLRGIPPRYWHKVCRLKPGLTAEWLARTKPSGRDAR